MMSETKVTAALRNDTRTLAVMLPSWVGDTVMASGLLRTCAMERPNMRLEAILRPGLGALLEGLPYLSAIREAPMKGAMGPVRCARVLKQCNADAVLILPNSFRSALIGCLSRVKQRIGYARDRRSFLLTDALESPARKSPISLLDYFEELAQFTLGSCSIDMTPRLEVTADQQALGDQLVRTCERQIIILNPGGNRTSKRWPIENFVSLGHRLNAELGADLVITGAPSEAKLVAQIAKALPGSIDLTAKGLSLASLKGVIHRASLMITNDTGPRHIAAALGTPVVTLFGPTDPRWTSLPGIKERLLVAEPFLPEELLADEHAELCKVDRITTADVFASAQTLLS